MRFMRLTTNYAQYLTRFYRERSALQRQPYSAQYQALMDDGFGWADFWTHALTPFGYEVWEPVANAKPMQMAWAHEHGVRYARQTWLADILAAQVKAFQPEILFADDSATFSPDFLRHLRQQCPAIRLMLGWCAPPDFQRADTAYAAHDVVMSNEPEIAAYFQRQGKPSYYVKHAFEPRILDGEDVTRSKNILFSFIGSMFPGAFHQERDTLIRGLLETTPLEIWSNIHGLLRPHIRLIAALFQQVRRFPAVEAYLVELPLLRRYNGLRRQRDASFYTCADIASRIHAPVFGRQMFQTLAQSMMTLNHHGDRRWNAACNMRLFEATGMGACLLTDWKDNLPELFDPEREVVTYRSLDECVEKANWLLNHPQQAADIARAGQARTLREHTFANRAEQVHDIISTNL